MQELIYKTIRISVYSLGLLSLGFILAACSSQETVYVKGKDIILNPELSIRSGAGFDAVIPSSGVFEDHIGSVFEGDEVIRTFEIQNTGQAVLSLKLISEQEGFVMTDEFPAQMAPKESKIFTIKVLTDRVGDLSKDVKFETNMPEAKDFVFRYRIKIQPRFDILSSVDGSQALVANKEIDTFDSTSDGRYVVFTTLASNLTQKSGAGVNTQVYLKDTQTGNLRVVSENAAGELGNGNSSSPRISEDGKYVYFLSSSKNLVSGITFPAVTPVQLYRKDLELNSISLVSKNVLNAISTANVVLAAISSDGRKALFGSSSRNLMQLPNCAAGPAGNLCREDPNQMYMSIDAGVPTLVSSNGASWDLRWDSRAKNLKQDQAAIFPNILDNQRQSLALVANNFRLSTPSSTSRIYLLDASNPLSLAVDLDARFAGNFINPVASEDGRYLMFSSDSSALASSLGLSGVTGYQVYLKDLSRAEDAYEIVSARGKAADMLVSDAASRPVGISQDGKWVIFFSKANNFVSHLGGGDALFMRNRSSGELTLMSSKDGSARYSADLVERAHFSREGKFIDMVASSIDFAGVIAAGKQLYRKRLVLE